MYVGKKICPDKKIILKGSYAPDQNHNPEDVKKHPFKQGETIARYAEDLIVEKRKDKQRAHTFLKNMRKI